MMAKADSIRDVIAFPKTQRAQCLLTGAPSKVDEAQLRELHIRLRSAQPAAWRMCFLLELAKMAILSCHVAQHERSPPPMPRIDLGSAVDEAREAGTRDRASRRPASADTVS